MIICPGCATEQPVGSWPWISMDWDAQHPDTVAWWCPQCLARRVADAHAGDCRCDGCQHRADKERVA